MQDIPHLFHTLQPSREEAVIELDRASAWAFTESGVRPTVKWDGQPCCVADGQLYRHDPKADTTWTLVNPKRAQDKMAAGAWRRLAVELGLFDKDAPIAELFQTAAVDAMAEKIPAGSYELVGPGIKSNRHKAEEPTLIRHGYGEADIDLKGLNPLEGFLACYKAVLLMYVEGIVFHSSDSQSMCQVTRRDLNLPWPDRDMELMAERSQARQAAAQAASNNKLRLVGPTGQPL